jgi:hypothetical protein
LFLNAANPAAVSAGAGNEANNSTPTMYLIPYPFQPTWNYQSGSQVASSVHPHGVTAGAPSAGIKRAPAVAWDDTRNGYHLQSWSADGMALRAGTPDAVEFAVSPQAGQASTACPTREALAIERNGSAHFPRQFEIAGDIRSSDRQN